MSLIQSVRKIAKSGVVLVLGRETRPRTIFWGLAAGYRIVVSPEENLGCLLGTTEPHLLRAIKRYVVEGDTVYDIGANIGYVSLSLAKRVGVKGRVVAFEPLPANVKLLQQAIAESRLANIEVFEVAASGKSGEAVIRVADNPSMASLVWHRGDASSAQHCVKTVAVDELIETGQLSPPTFVKIDVEGAESQVLVGMQRTITTARPVIFMECSDAGRETAWRLLSELNYHCQSAVTLKRITAFEEFRHSDFLWLPAPDQPSQ
jgi:FkbM family methyltransferase